MPHKRKPKTQQKNPVQKSESSSVISYIKQPFVSLQGFFNSKSLKDNKLFLRDRLSRLFNRIELSPFVFLAFLEKVKADSIENLYALEPVSSVQYLIQQADFPNLRSDLIKYCNTIFFDVAQAVYELDSAAQCVSQDNQLGPIVNISVEVGKNLTSTFMECLNTVLKPECDEYFSHHQDEEQSPKWGLAQTLTVAFCGALAVAGCACYCYYNRSNCSSSSSSSDYRHNSSSGPTVVVVNDNYESSSHHHNNDHGSSVIWHHY